MKDIILFYYTFKQHFKLPVHLSELYLGAWTPRKTQKARDQYIEEVVTKIIQTIDEQSSLKYFTIDELLKIFQKANKTPEKTSIQKP